MKVALMWCRSPRGAFLHSVSVNAEVAKSQIECDHEWDHADEFGGPDWRVTVGDATYEITTVKVVEG